MVRGDQASLPSLVAFWEDPALQGGTAVCDLPRETETPTFPREHDFLQLLRGRPTFLPELEFLVLCI